MHNKLWYTRPASEWIEGLPIGTGRLAAMILGSEKRERLALNHEWLWKGTNRHRDTTPAADKLALVRELLADEKYEEATDVGNAAFGGSGGISDSPSRVDPYQPAGDLYIDFNHNWFHNYRRELDLDTATVTVSYKEGRNTTIRRQYIAHLIKDCILVHITSDGDPVNCSLWLDRTYDPSCTLFSKTVNDHLSLSGAITNGINFCTQASVSAISGSLSVIHPDKILISESNEFLIVLNIGTSANEENAEEESQVPDIAGTDWQHLWYDHVEEHKKNFGGLKLRLPFAEVDLPTDKRMQKLREGEDDPSLALLYFNYGRYLLCSSSANGTLPANLQGKWNEDLNPAWESDYHHDINLQMCYWPAEAGGLQKYVGALLDHIERFVPHGRKAAQDLYGCNGVWFPIQTDPWGRSTPESCGWAVWIGAAAWLGQHMWWHFQYGQDRTFLQERGYPFIKEVAAFYKSYLVEDADGTLQIMPSQSPENRFVDSGSKHPVSLCVSSAMDIQLAWDVLTHAIEASRILDCDAQERQQWQQMLAKLQPLQVGSKGQLLEWNKEFEEAEPGHRHISHLYGLFPGEQICKDTTPELFEAARTSLEIRLNHDGGHTGWSRAWTACCMARLGEGNKALSHIQHLIADFSTDTLLDLHPPRIFQIDGNLGGTAAILEMLLQSYKEVLHFLPALPSSWHSGSVQGIRARGGYTVAIYWDSSQLSKATIVALTDRACKVKQVEGSLTVSNTLGNAVVTELQDDLLCFNVKAGEIYKIESISNMSASNRRSESVGANNHSP
jgi:alpha-L-fucosidase 2